MADQPIIVKKIKKGGGHGHHGGAWKIAYADFVTAMMAFFLLMWLINVSSEETKKGIADYFSTAVITFRQQDGAAGMVGGMQQAKPNNNTTEKSNDDNFDHASYNADDAPENEDFTQNIQEYSSVHNVSNASAQDQDGKQQNSSISESKKESQQDQHKGLPTFEQLNGAYQNELKASDQKDATQLDKGESAAQKYNEMGSESQKDQGKSALVLQQPKVASKRSMHFTEQDIKEILKHMTVEDFEKLLKAQAKIDAESKAEQKNQESPVSQVEKAMKETEQEDFEKSIEQLREALNSIEKLKNYSENIIFEITDQGLRIQIIDSKKHKMFKRGSREPEEFTAQIIKTLGGVIKGLPNKVNITGHTDAVPFSGGGSYTNWELSSDRAHAARRIFEESGINKKRFLDVTGRADRELLNPSDPEADQNRRIAITLLYKHLSPQS